MGANLNLFELGEPMGRTITVKWQRVVPILLMAGVALAALFAITSRATADEGPIFNPANGHSYEAVTAPAGGINWDTAKAAAEARGGYLATLTSAEENQFIVDNLPLAVIPGYYWLGGVQPDPASVEPDEGWTWVTGEAFSYTNWSAIEPSDTAQDGAQDAIQLWHTPTGSWNDQYRSTMVAGYVVEYENAPQSATFLGGVGTAGTVVDGVDASFNGDAASPTWQPAYLARKANGEAHPWGLVAGTTEWISACTTLDDLACVLATSKSGTHWEPRDQGVDGGLVSSLRALL